MPLMISLRKFRLESTTGHCIQFEPREPVYVPDVAVSDAMKAGCVPAEEADIPFHEDLSRAKVEFVGDVRSSMIYLAIDAIVKRNNSKDFDGGGVPRQALINDTLGFETTRKEIVQVYQQYMQVKAENLEYALHPAAPQILKVLEAGDKGELLELAEEFGVENEKSKGLSVRDLRKLLLVKLSGIGVGD